MNELNHRTCFATKWPLVKLGDVCEVVTGNTPLKSNSEYYGGNIPWIKPNNLGKSMYVSKSSEYLSYEGGKIARLLPVGAVLVSCIGSLGKLAIAEKVLATNQQINALVPSPKIDSEYLYFACSVLKEKLSKAASATIIPIVNKTTFSGIEIPFPTLSKQRQIAAQLKSQLAEVVKARQAAEKQLRDAKILSAALLREIFSNNHLSQYPVIPLGDAGEVVSGITLGRKISQKNKNEPLRQVPYLRVANVKDGFLDLVEVKTIDVTETEIKKWHLQKGDILLTEGGDPDKLGRGTFWSEELPECIHQNHIFRVRFPHEKYLPEFIAAQIGSPYGKGYFFTHAKKTTGIATINQKVLKAFPLQTPELDVQAAIMASLSPRLTDAQTVCEGIKQQLQEVNLLSQKILGQAFKK